MYSVEKKKMEKSDRVNLSIENYVNLENIFKKRSTLT